LADVRFYPVSVRSAPARTRCAWPAPCDSSFQTGGSNHGSCALEHLGLICPRCLVRTPHATTASSVGGGLVSGAAHRRTCRCPASFSVHLQFCRCREKAVVPRSLRIFFKDQSTIGFSAPLVWLKACFPYRVSAASPVDAPPGALADARLPLKKLNARRLVAVGLSELSYFLQN
jgi:hypothetical protein